MYKKSVVIILVSIMLIMTAACGNMNNEYSSKQRGSNELTSDNNDKNDKKPQEQVNEKTGEAGNKTEEQSDERTGEIGNKQDDQANGNTGEAGGESVKQSDENDENDKHEPDEDSLLEISNKVLELMKNQDFREISKYVHEEKGVRFTPYSSVDKKMDRFLSADEMAGFADDIKKYWWGYYDGSGFDMMLTNIEYWDMFVWNTDYTVAENVSINEIAQQGNSVENLTDEYPEASFVEYHFSQLEPKHEGMDWCALRLVFEDYEGEWKLVAIVHAVWTI